ncbi:transposase [Acinetobacter sp. TSRC1-2]|uniref:transposase n=1 Tax=unclassified Acinetobacter TaxID=196816 RepID=UPI003CF69C3F
MTTNIHASTVAVSKKRRTYSAEFKHSIVQTCKEPHTSIASVALQYRLNENILSKWIRLFDGRQSIHKSAPPKPAFIALSYPERFNLSTAIMLPLHITLPDSNTEIGLKCQASKMPALAELLKALANMIRIDEIWLSTQPMDMRTGMDTAMAQIHESLRLYQTTWRRLIICDA